MDRHKPCPKCGYDLYGIANKHCPECGIEHAHYRILGIFYPADIRNLRDVGILLIPPSLLAATALIDQTGLLSILPFRHWPFHQTSTIAVCFVIAAAVAAVVVAARVTLRYFPNTLPYESRWAFGAAQAIKFLIAQVVMVITAILALALLLTLF